MLEEDGVSALQYRPDIDGLRAVAVLLVVFFHGGFQDISGGFVGVDIFFVISGFLITGIIYREEQSNDFSYISFYTRRTKRICPALFLTLSISAIISFFFLIPEDLRLFGRSLASAVFFYANWHFYTQVGYFDGPAIEKPLLHTWSLAVEEQFYLLWPALFLGLHRVLGKRYQGYAIAGLSCLSLAASQLMLPADPAQVFYLLPYRLWELLFGAFIAVVQFPQFSRRIATLLGAAGLTAIAYAALSLTPKTPFPGLNGLFPCVGAVLVILAGTRDGALSRRMLSFGPLCFIGKISYSLYLFHWPLFSFANLALGSPPGLWQRLLIIAASVGAAALSWRFVETPARRAIISFPVLALGTAAAALVLGSCGVLYNASMGLPFRVAPGVIEANLASLGISGSDCRNDPVPDLPARLCAIGAHASDMQYDFVVWGDSHAGHLALAFSDQAANHGRAGIVISAGGCGPFVHDPRVPPRCSTWAKRTAEWLKTQKRLQAIFLAGNWSAYAESGLLTFLDEDTPTAAESFSDTDKLGIAGTLQFLRSLNIQVIVVEDTPSFPMKVALCAARARMFGRPEDHCFVLGKSDFDRNTQRASAILHELSRRFGIPLIETASAFCHDDGCRAEKGGIIFFGDESHLNPAGARYLGSLFHIPWPSDDAEKFGAAAFQNNAGSSAQ